MNALRFLLYPFSLIYGLLVGLRNFLYDRELVKPTEYAIPVITVGNLTMGGTGKTPHVAYLARKLADYHPAVLSRGYLRKTRGFRMVGVRDSAKEVGDEPCMLKQKYPDLTIAVSADRALAIPQLLIEAPQTRVIILDDGFQHRALKPGLSILLTPWGKLYTHDHLFPVGNLREPASSARRADIIIVTRCPHDITQKDKDAIIRLLKPLPHQQVYFSHLSYFDPYRFFAPQQRIELSKSLDVLLVAGIGDPQPLLHYVKERVNRVFPRFFRDHHTYSRTDIESITTAWHNIDSSNKVILTTEKDLVKLAPYKAWFDKLQVELYIIPIDVYFQPDEERRFISRIQEFIRSMDY